jgi:hypothetical protein
MLLNTFSASDSIPLDNRYFGLSGKKASPIVTIRAGIPHNATKILHELYLKPFVEVTTNVSQGMTAQASPATEILPTIQNVARAHSIRPRRDLH